MSEVWETLVATALVGTDRKTPHLSGIEGELGHLLQQLSEDDLNSQLLSAAGAIAVSHQAGLQASDFAAQPLTPCVAEDQLLCPEKVHGLLEMVMSGTYTSVLPELLDLIQLHGMRVSETSIPMLLKLGKQRSELRDRIRAVVGQRGQWLAQQNPAWSYMSGIIKGIERSGQIHQDIAKQQWDTETKATRLSLLQKLREQDPDFARDLLVSSWKQEKAKERAEFLNCLKIRLGETDEDFLDAALNDRSKEVRAIASMLLASLPTSQFCQRMTQRVEKLISIQQKASGLALTVTLPPADNTEDGLVATQSKNLGKRSSLLMQIIAAVPLSHWQYPAAEIIEAASDQDAQVALMMGWRLATQRQRNPEWAKAFIKYYQRDLSKTSNNLTELVDILPLAEQESYLGDWLALLVGRKEWAEWRQSLLKVIAAYPSPSLTFSRSIILWFHQDCKADMARKTKTYPYHLRSLINELGYYLHPDSYADASKMVQQLNPKQLDDQRETLLENWLEILSFRQNMTQLFTSSESKETYAR